MRNPHATRREFLTVSAIGLTTAGLSLRTSAEPPGPPDALVDVHVYLGRWPFGRLKHDEPASLVEALRAAGVTQAWAGSFEGLLHKDVAAVNARLAVACRGEGAGLLVPFGAINPTLPDWEDDLRRCHEEHGMPGIRLHPTWHGYKLDDHRFGRALQLSAERRLIVQLVGDSVNVRRPFLALPMAPIDLAPLAGQIGQAPGLQFVVLQHDHAVDDAQRSALAAIDGVYLAAHQTDAALAKLAEELSAERLLLGSGAPLQPPASLARQFTSSGLSESRQRLIAHETASRLLAEADGR